MFPSAVRKMSWVSVISILKHILNLHHCHVPKYCSMTGLYHTGSAATRTLYNIIYIVHDHQLDLSLPLEKLWRPQRLQGTIRHLSTLPVLYTQYQVSSHITHDKISHTFLSSVTQTAMEVIKYWRHQIYTRLLSEQSFSLYMHNASMQGQRVGDFST